MPAGPDDSRASAAAGQAARVCVVIVNYHAQDLVLRCLDSLATGFRDRLTCVVVDNSETADTGRIAAARPDTVILRPGANLGFAGGCNVGIAHALGDGADFILLLNPDARGEDDFLRPLVDVLTANPDLGVATPRILNDDDTRGVWYGGARMNWWTGGPKHLFTDAAGDRTWLPVPFVSGCAMLLRAAAVRQVGPMDERYFLYFEDADYVQALRRAGWGAAYVPAARVLHAQSSVTGLHSPRYVYYFARNRIWFMRRWARRHHFLGFMAFNTLVRLPGALLVFGLLRRRPGLAVTFLRGFVHGLRGRL